MNEKVSIKSDYKLSKLKEKYKVHENLIIARQARKTIRFIEKNCENISNKYHVLKDKIITSCYSILEWIYRANIFQDIEDKKIIVQIQMIKFLFRRGIKKRYFN